MKPKHREEKLEGLHVLFVNPFDKAYKWDGKTLKEACGFAEQLPFVHRVDYLDNVFSKVQKKKLVHAIQSQATILLVILDFCCDKGVSRPRLTEKLAAEHLNLIAELCDPEWTKIKNWSLQLHRLLKKRDVESLVKACFLFLMRRHSVLIVENWAETNAHKVLCESFGKLGLDRLTVLHTEAKSLTARSDTEPIEEAILSKFVPSILGVVKNNPRVRPQKKLASTWGAIEAPTMERVLSSYVSKEFESEPAIDEFRALWRSVGSSGLARTKRAISLLTAIIFSRYLARCNIEGHDFTTNIVLADHTIRSSVELGEEIYNFFGVTKNGKTVEEPVTYFHFGDPRFLSSVFELLHSEYLTLDVVIDSLQCMSIRQLALSDYVESYARGVIQSKSSCNSLGIAIRRKGYVEVYAGDTLVLWYDRFRWRARPFRKLDECLTKYFEHAKSPPVTLRLAISELLDQQLSSIIAFVPQGKLNEVLDNKEFSLNKIVQDLGHYDSIAESSLLPNSVAGDSKGHRLSIAGTPINRLKHSTVVAMARLDGILLIEHCEDEQFRIVRVMQRLDKNTRLDSEKKEDSHQGHLLGTGGGAAKSLAERIPRNGFVVKVSASGELLVLQGKASTQKSGS